MLDDLPRRSYDAIRNSNTDYVIKSQEIFKLMMSYEEAPRYHPVVQGSNPKHTIYAFKYYNFVLYLSVCWEKDENKEKEDGFGPYFEKTLKV